MDLFLQTRPDKRVEASFTIPANGGVFNQDSEATTFSYKPCEEFYHSREIDESSPDLRSDEGSFVHRYGSSCDRVTEDLTLCRNTSSLFNKDTKDSHEEHRVSVNNMSSQTFYDSFDSASCHDVDTAPILQDCQYSNG